MLLAWTTFLLYSSVKQFLQRTHQIVGLTVLWAIACGTTTNDAS